MKFLLAGLLGLFTVFSAVAGELKELPPKPAPALMLPALVGGKTDLAQFRGKVVLVNFWATWCPPCRKEMPSMNRLAAQLNGQPFVMLGVNAGDTPGDVRAFLDKVPVDFPILMDEEGVTLKPWHAFVFPTSYVVDKQGQLRLGLVGSVEWDEPQVVARIQALLNE